MANQSESQATAVQNVLQATQGDTAEVKLEALSKIPPPSGGTTDRLWMLLVFIFGVLLILGLFAIYRLIEAKIDAAALIGVFTTVLAGLLGLFAPSPLKSGK